MNVKDLNKHREQGHEHNNIHHGRRSYWIGAKRDWRVWVGVIIMLAAIMYYVMSENFSLAPHRQMMQHQRGK